MSVEDFLSRHWQKSPLFMPRGISLAVPELAAEELAWLATLDDVESRIVFTDLKDGTSRYRVEEGPFDESMLASLPAENWTLLVHDVEKHLPVFRHLISEASFIPDWRIDDLLVSFAAPGGSVGPHRDNYDVFLCQGLGIREWRLAPATDDLKEVESGGLVLLEPFDVDHSISAVEGDVLYLPPGIAHWGIATEACMTYSIGMRAPHTNDGPFYCDPDLDAREAEPGLISDRAIERARRCFAASNAHGEADLVRQFGCLVTGLKAWLEPETPSTGEFHALLKSEPREFRVHGMARLAFCKVGGQRYIFVNGSSRSVTSSELEYFRGLCDKRVTGTDNADFVELNTWLAGKGAFDLPPYEQDNAT
jgi:50S ribosomal protein L16 3-hydroxylase